MQPKRRTLSTLCITAWLAALGASHALAYDPFSNNTGGYTSGTRYGDPIVSPNTQPRFDRQWWETDDKGNSPQTTSNASNALVDCRQGSATLKTLRGRALDETRRYATCLDRADAREDCSRDFDAVKRAQQDQEDTVRDISRNCR